jgi:peptidoglycan/LPS O-acetylase OafA/YrhL
MDPLLHLWSLSLEWQFYFLFPLLVQFRSYLQRFSCVVSFLLFVASGAMWIWTSPAAAYFLPHSRAMGLLAGVSLALFQHDWGVWELPLFIAELGSALGILSIVSSAILVSNDSSRLLPVMLFPSIAGTVLCIAVGSGKYLPFGIYLYFVILFLFYYFLKYRAF